MQLTPKQQLEEKLFEDIKVKKQILSIVGAFGDVENCEGYIEQVIYPSEGGILIKFYGCTYFFKGWPDNKIVEGIGLAKAMISVFPRMILGNSVMLRMFLILMFFFGRNKLVHWLHVYSTMIYGHVTLKVGFQVEKYGQSVEKLNKQFN